mgnify:CR=1 FL=1
MKDETYKVTKTVKNEISDEKFISECRNYIITDIISWIITVVFFTLGTFASIIVEFPDINRIMVLLMKLICVLGTIFIYWAFIRDVRRWVFAYKQGKVGYALLALHNKLLFPMALSKYIEWKNQDVLKMQCIFGSKIGATLISWKFYTENIETKQKDVLTIPGNNIRFQTGCTDPVNKNTVTLDCSGEKAMITN